MEFRNRRRDLLPPSLRRLGLDATPPEDQHEAVREAAPAIRLVDA